MTAIVVFSLPGPTLFAGRTQCVNYGNTAVVAKLIATRLARQVILLQVTPAYPTSYPALLAQTRAELNGTASPQITTAVPYWEREQLVFLGFPVWWGRLPRPVAVWAQRQAWAGKRLMPFCTHEGSGFGNSLAELAQLAPASQLGPGLALRGTRATSGQAAVDHWLIRSGFKKAKEHVHDS